MLSVKGRAGVEKAGDLSRVSWVKIKAELRELLLLDASGADRLRRAADLWAEGHRRGEDMSDLRGGLFDYLELIHTGRYAAEAVARFCGRTDILREVVKLPPAEQKRIALSRTVPVAEVRGGEVTIRQVPVAGVARNLVAQVFAPTGRVRTAEEQAELLKAAPPAPEPAKPAVRKVNLKPAAPLVGVEAVAEAKATLAASESETLGQNAKIRGTTKSALIRDALFTLGLI